MTDTGEAKQPETSTATQAAPLHVRGCQCGGSIESAKLAGEWARHYGNLRFTMFSVFTTIAGAFLALPFTPAGASFVAVDRQRILSCTAGFATSLLFGLAEYRVSTLVTFYQEKAYAVDSLGKPPRHSAWHYIVILTMVFPAAITGVFWILLLTGTISTAQSNQPPERAADGVRAELRALQSAGRSAAKR